MIEAAVDLNARPFLDGIQKLDHAVTNFRAKIITFTQAFEALHLAAATISAQFEKMRAALDYGAQMADLAAQTGAGAGDMAVLTQALKNAGGGMESASTFTKKLQTALSGLNEEGAGTSTAFRRLGIDVMSMRKLPLIQQVEMLQRAFQNIGNPADRVKLATDLLGKSGAQSLPFLVNSSAMAEAKAQIGDLKGVLDRNSEAFARLSHAFDAMGVKATQFYAGFAEGIDGNTKKFTAFLNGADLTKFGKQLGETSVSLAKMAGVLKELEPLFIALGARWLFQSSATSRLVVSLGQLAAWLTRVRGEWESVAMAATRAGFAQRMALPSTGRMALGPGINIIESKIIESPFARLNRGFMNFAANVRGLPAIFAVAMRQMAASIDPLFASLLAMQYGFKAGGWINEKFTHQNEKLESATAQNDIATNGAEDIKGFEEKRKKIFSEGDRADLLKSIDEAGKALTEKLEEGRKKFTGDRLEDFEATAGIQKGFLSWERDRVGKQKLASTTDQMWNPVAGRTPVSSLGRVGGAMNMIGHGGLSSGDPLLNENRRQTKVLENILNAMTGSPTSSRPPVYHST